jgi:hypothetical protein
MTAGLTSFIGIIFAPFIKKYFQRITDKIFYKDKYDFSKVIFELSEILNKNLNREELLMKITDKLLAILKVKQIYFLFPSENLTYDKNIGLKKSDDNISEEIIKAIENINQPILFRSEK